MEKTISSPGTPDAELLPEGPLCQPCSQHRGWLLPHQGTGATEPWESMLGRAGRGHSDLLGSLLWCFVWNWDGRSSC